MTSWPAPVTASTISAGSSGLVQQFGVGVESIDVSAATQHGVWVATMPGVNAEPVAEHAVALLLALVHRLPEARRGFQPGHWGEPAGGSLADAVVVAVSHARGRAPVLDAAALAALPHRAHVVNAARAGLVDHDALVSALDAGRLAGADHGFFTAAATRLGAALEAHLEHRPPADLINPLLTAPRTR